MIFKEGELGDRAFVVQSGEVEIFKILEGTKTILGVVGPGGIFGEMALIDDSPRMANAQASEMTTTILVSRPMLEKKLAKADPFIRGLLNIFASHLRRFAAKQSQSDSGSAPRREADD
jgi:CRP-like cAMP-binding protein